MYRNSIAAILALVAVPLAGCSRERPRPNPELPPYELVEGGRLRVREDLLPLLKCEKVDESEVAAEIGGLGNISFAPGAAYALRVPFNGFVESVHVDVGQIVTDNQPLATVHSSDLAKLRADLDRMTAEIESEQDAYRRAVTLVSSGAIPDRKIVELKSRVASLQAQAGGLRQSLQAVRASPSGGDLLELHAPRGGHVIVRKLDPGEQVEDPENTPAFVIADPQRLVVKAHFPERDAPLLAEGFPCRIIVPSLGDVALPGRVSSVVRAIDPQTRSVQVVCTIDEIDSRLRAEMLARVTVHIHGPLRVLVPRSAVLLRRDTRVVLVRHGDRELERRTVVVGVNVDTKLEVISGLSAGEEVVVEGAVLLDGELDRLL
jgi:cobalt-zinc-cadmium efflux system membrane fusion protein